MLEIKEAVTLEKLRALERPWNELLGRSEQANLFVSFDWVSSWFESPQEPKPNPLVLSAWDGNRLVGIAAMQLYGNTLGFAAQQYSNHLDFLAEKGMEKEAARVLVGKMLELEWNRIELKHVKDEPIFLEALEEASAKKGFKFEKNSGEGSNVVSLPATMEEYFASLEKKWRKNLRNDLSRAEREFKSIETRLADKKDFAIAWKKFVELHLLNMQQRKTRSILGQKWFHDFYKLAAEKALASGKLFLMELLLDGKTGGVLFGIRQGKTLNVMNVGYNPEIGERQSIGTVLFLKAIESCIGNGITTFDLLAGNPEYKKVFGAVEKDRLEIKVFRSENDARLHKISQGAKVIGKKILGR